MKQFKVVICLICFWECFAFVNLQQRLCVMCVGYLFKLMYSLFC